MSRPPARGGRTCGTPADVPQVAGVDRRRTERAAPPTAPRLRAQALRFVLAGVLAAAADYVSYRLLLTVGLPVSAAKAAGFVIGTSLSYLMNRRWTFRAEHSTRAVARFAVVYTATLGVNVGVNALVLSAVSGRPAAVSLAWLIAQAVASTLNFVAVRQYVFAARPRRHGRAPPVLLPAVAAGWLAVWACGRVLDIAVTKPHWRTVIPTGTGVAAVVVGAVIIWTARRHPRAAAQLLAAATAVAVSGLITLGLHGTRWGLTALYGDSSFRTEAATRYAGTPRLVDYAYRGVPAYYPPALPWVEGRLADLVGVPAWQAMKPVELVLFAAIPVLAFLLWRRVLPQMPAAIVVFASTMAAAELRKPDEWLLLACLLPWWIELVRGARAPRARAWPVWAHGLVLGLMLLTHTYYFMPMAVATLLGVALDLARRRPFPLPVLRGAAIGAVGLAVSAVYWVPIAAARLRGAPWNNQQLRYAFPGANLPPFPVPTSPAGFVGAVGVLFLLGSLLPRATGRRLTPVARALAVALAGAYLTMGIGAAAQRVDIGLLTFKTGQLVTCIQVIAGALGLYAVAHAAASWRPRRAGAIHAAAAGIGVLVLAAPAAAGFARHWAVGPPALTAQTTPYPSGASPAGRHGMAPVHLPTYVEATDPSPATILRTYSRLSGRPAGPRTVLVTSNVELLATSTVHPFLIWSGIYSNPLGQFYARRRLLERVARSPGPAAAATLLRHNPYDRVDGLVLERSGDQDVLRLRAANFPDRTRAFGVTFDPRLFAGPQFAVRRLGRLVVIAVRPTGSHAAPAGAGR